MKFKLSKREKAPEIELKSKDSSNISLSPEERGYLALKLRFGGKFEAEKILQIIRQKATYPYTYLKVRNLNKLDKQLVLRTFFFGILTPFFHIQFKNTSNLIFPGFKVSFKSFFPKNFKTGITF